MRWLLQKLDNLIYAFVVPFGVIYVFPLMCRHWDQQLGIALPQYEILDVIGQILMQLGGALALWCAVLMYYHQHGSVSPLQKPKRIIDTGPYRVVRHPMMWALNFVLIGEILTYSSPLIAVWFVIWCRFAALYISRYEEPYLVRQFKDDYLDYCHRTPRWFPFLQPRSPAELVTE
jgi:protein-S-isoprenylcysteine O-methyltransferase Ste14